MHHILDILFTLLRLSRKVEEFPQVENSKSPLERYPFPFQGSIGLIHFLGLEFVQRLYIVLILLKDRLLYGCTQKLEGCSSVADSDLNGVLES